jgi:hypothetical protein
MRLHLVRPERVEPLPAPRQRQVVHSLLRVPAKVKGHNRCDGGVRNISRDADF